MDDAPSPSSLYQQAIDVALNGQWEDALKINKKILKLDPQNIDALNRQAKALMELGKANQAKKSYSEVLKIDPYNPIAQKNLKLMKSYKPTGQTTAACCQNGKLSPALFLQEPGKTKMVNLLKVAEPQKLSQAFCGMKVLMAVKNHKITIVDTNGDYLGVLPDDISHHLLRLYKGGNRYDLFIKSIRVNSLSVLIKETFRSKKFKNQPSFLEYSDSTHTSNLLPALDKGDSEEVEEYEETEEI